MYKWDKATRRVKTEARKIEMNPGIVQVRRKKEFHNTFKICRFFTWQETNYYEFRWRGGMTGNSLPAF